ncbi:MAG: DUF2231 domain-containing protein [Myxococcota bacterium]
MLPDPLHPAIVHLPIALALLIPVFSILGILAIRSDLLPRRVWWGVVLLQALLAGSAWLATETGENEEERVERVLEHDLIHEHEEAAERLLLLAAIGLVPVGLGLWAGRRGAIGRLLHVLLALVVVAAAISTGRLGGELVYQHGAATAYTESAEGPED